MCLATKEFIDFLYEGCQRRHCYRVTFKRPYKTLGLVSSSSAIKADNKPQAIGFARRIMEFEYPDENVSDMVLESAFRLPDDHGGRY